MRKNRQNAISLKEKLVFLVFFILVSIALHFKSYNQYPSKTHTWAQSDHYAIALGFLDNGFDFFHPKTFTLNHQFPADKPLKNPKGITAVDFPILHYTVAISMKIFKTKEPWVFRLVSWLWSFIALFFLFTTLLRIKGVWGAYTVVSFILLIPIYTFYQNSFLPSIAAFNSLLIGISFFLRYFYLKQKRAFYFGLLFLTLAALMRFTQVIFLIALTGSFFLTVIRKKRINTNIFFSTLGLIVVGLYFSYNSYLSNKYGSVFLNKPIIADSFSDLLLHLLREIKMYIRRLTTPIHVVIIGVFLYILKSQKIKLNIEKIEWEQWFYISLIGVFIFNMLMSYHMSAHDYYALDTWIPILSLGFIYIVLQIDFSVIKSHFSIITVLLFVSLLTLGAIIQHHKYKSAMNLNEIVIADFKESTSFLDKNIQIGDKKLVICAYGWNTPMVGWQRDTYRVAWNFKEQIPEALQQDYDIVITHNASFEDTVIRSMPEFSKKVKKIADNSLVTLWKINP